MSDSIPYDEDLRYRYLGGVAVLTIVSTIIAWLRLYVRLFILKNFGSDDWTMLVGSMLAVVTNGLLMQTYKLGLGTHINSIPPNQVPSTFEFLWLVQATNMFALYFVRLSITLTFLRIVPKTKFRFRAFMWTTIACLTASTIHITIIYFAQCIPIQKVWLPETNGWCLNQAAYEAGPWAYQAVSIITDIIIVAIAISLFSKLQMAMRTKVAVVLLCSVGVFTCICAIIKTIFLPTVFDDNPDKTWSVATLGLFAALEISVGMICGCLPCLRPLFDPDSYRLSSAQKYLTWSYGSGSSNRDGARSRSIPLRDDSSSDHTADQPVTQIQKTTEIEVKSVSKLASRDREDLGMSFGDMVLPMHEPPLSTAPTLEREK